VQRRKIAGQVAESTLCGVSTRESRRQRGRRRGKALTARALQELRAARVTAGVALSEMAGELGCSPSLLWRIEAEQVSLTIQRLAEMASILGMELSIGLHPIDDPIRDRGHQALIGRFRALLGAQWRVTAETPLPGIGDRRSWDLLLRVAAQRVGIEAETRIRDMQSLVRRIRQRERDGGVDAIVLVLSDSAMNRRLVGELREVLGPAYATSPRLLLGALRAGAPLPGSGVVLV
jgi:transcriptional regulator with XRE-family HTH domain